MFGVRSTLLSFCLSRVSYSLAAQIALEHTAQEHMGPRLVSPQQEEAGEAIARAREDLRCGLISKPDCSHFVFVNVHAVYKQAGFP